MAFKFEIFQRVMLPGTNFAVQGIIVSVSARASAEPQYLVQWLKVADIDKDRDAIVAGRQFKESELVAAQPPKMVSQREADQVADAAANAVRNELYPNLASLRAQIEKLEADAKRRQKRNHNRKRRG